MFSEWIRFYFNDNDDSNVNLTAFLSSVEYIAYKWLNKISPRSSWLVSWLQVLVKYDHLQFFFFHENFRQITMWFLIGLMIQMKF